jgi:hypothetical protein
VFTDLGGFQAFWKYTRDGTWATRIDETTMRTNWRFKLSKPLSAHKRYFVVHYSMKRFPYTSSEYDEGDYWANGAGGRPLYYISSTNTSLCNTWIHLQVFMHWSNTTNGYQTAWINNDLLANDTGRRNDPRGYPEWNANKCVFGYPTSGKPFALIQLYTTTNSPEQYYYWDDAVASSTKVPETYAVSSQT